MVGIQLKSATKFECGGALISAKGNRCQSKYKDFGLTYYFSIIN
jgi:hypothetical protein